MCQTYYKLIGNKELVEEISRAHEEIVGNRGTRLLTEVEGCGVCY